MRITALKTRSCSSSFGTTRAAPIMLKFPWIYAALLKKCDNYDPEYVDYARRFSAYAHVSTQLYVSVCAGLSLRNCDMTTDAVVGLTLPVYAH